MRKQTQREFELAHMKSVDTFSDTYRIRQSIEREHADSIEDIGEEENGKGDKND